MKSFLFVLAVVALMFAVGEAKKEKRVPKPVRALKRLCEKATTRGLKYDDGNFTMVMDDVTEWCPVFLANFSDTFGPKAKEGRKYDVLKEFGKVCSWYMRKYSDADADGLEGLGELCYDYQYAMNVSLGIIDEESEESEEEEVRVPKAIKLLDQMCRKANAGKLKWRNETYDDVFEDVIEFCVGYVEELQEPLANMEKMKEKPKYNAIADLTFICGWYEKKYGDKEVVGPLAGLDVVCFGFDFIGSPL